MLKPSTRNTLFIGTVEDIRTTDMLETLDLSTIFRTLEAY